MKKIIIFLISFLILNLSFSFCFASEDQLFTQIINKPSNDRVSHKIDIILQFGSFVIKRTNLEDRIYLENFGQKSIPGEPSLPTKIISLAIPPNTIPVKISYSISESFKLPGRYHIRAAPMPILENNQNEMDNLQKIFMNNYKEIYFSNDQYPEKIVDFVRTSGFRDYNLIDLEIVPFSYNPLKGYLTFYQNITLSVEYQYYSIQEKTTKKESFRTCNIATDIILNYEQAQQWYENYDNSHQELFDFVIITLDSLTEAVEPLVQWEKEKGRNVSVVTKTWIESQYNGYDSAARIRNFLIDKYPDSEWGIEDVLIVGHYSDIPLREVYQSLSGQENPETDFYYAELSKMDNESWDIDEDHKYGENSDPIDFYAEVNVGRIPWSDYEIVNHICKKSVNYEKNTDPTFKNNILLLADFVDEQTDGAVYTEYLANSDINTWMSSWLKTRLYNRGSNFPMDHILNHLNVISVWSKGKYAVVAWHAHGNPYGSGNFISVNDCPLLRDEFPAIISAASCSNSDTDYLNIGQAMMKQGAVGFLGANKAAYYCPGWTNPNDGSDQSFKYFFTSCITSGEYTQGQALQYAIREMYTKGLWTRLKYETFIHSSLWGNPDLGIASFSDNDAPMKPTRPIGENEGKINKEYSFTSNSIDPDNDKLYYCWSWGDGNNDWVGPFDSGEDVSASHIWMTQGSFEVKVKSRDINGKESEWSEPLSFIAPKNRVNNIIRWFLDKIDLSYCFFR